MQTDFKTTGIAPEARAAFWTRGYSSRFAQVRVDPLDRKEFQAELKMRSLGPITFAWVRSRPALVCRTKEVADQATERSFGFLMELRGGGLVSHCGHESRFEAGDIILNDVTRPMTCNFPRPTEGITVRVSEAAVKSRIPFADDMLGVRIAGSVALVSTAINMARNLVLEDYTLPSECEIAAANSLLDILAIAYSTACDKRAPDISVSGVRRVLVTEFIESHLHDPGLAPSTIASGLRISPRYLRKLMAQYGESASSYILRRRLEESGKQLRAGLYRNRTVTDIAYSLGFNSTAHFARVFKVKFGMTPTDYRMSNTRGDARPMQSTTAEALAS